MVVLSEEVPEDFTPEKLSGAYRRLALRYGMPIDWRERVRVAPSVHACRAVVAVRLRWPEQRGRDAAPPARAQLRRRAARRLRHARAGRRAGRAAGRRAGRVGRRARGRGGAAGRHARPRARRRPPRARRTTSSAGRRRSAATPAPPTSCCATRDPPADWPTARRVDLPGFRPVEAYEAAIANLAPELTRRPDPRTAGEVLEWAGVPLATAEVAAVMDREPPTCAASWRARARFEPVGVDGYWSPRPDRRSFRFMR